MEDFSKARQLVVLQSDIETRKGVYNERLLADIHDKLADESGWFYIDLIPNDGVGAKQFIDAIYHVARRLKDCANIAGVVIPAMMFEEGDGAVQSLVAKISSKHSQYRYFVHKKDWIAEDCKDFISIP